MSTLIKALRKGSPLYILIKGDTVKYLEGSIETIGNSRIDVTPNSFPGSMTVLDVTFVVDGKTYTETIPEQAEMFCSKQLGDPNLIASDTKSILQELKTSLKNSEDYLKSTETEIPKQTKRVEEYKELIATLDTEYAEKKALDKRISQLEESTQHTNAMLQEIINKLNK